MNPPGMQPNDLIAKTQKLDLRLRRTADAIVVYAKSLLPVLRDAGREYSAKELELLLFEYDVALQECGKFANDNIGEILRLIAEGPR